jgi:predicted nucleic acid-binding protein
MRRDRHQRSGDDYLIQLAKDGDADALVTRDHHFDGIRVSGLEILPPVNPADK